MGTYRQLRPTVTRTRGAQLCWHCSELGKFRQREIPRLWAAPTSITSVSGASLLSFLEDLYSSPIATTRGKQNEQSTNPSHPSTRSPRSNRLLQGMDLPPD